MVESFFDDKCCGFYSYNFNSAWDNYCCLLQKKGSGIGSVFGGSSDSYRSKRGADKFLYYITIGLGILFALIPFSLLFLS